MELTKTLHFLDQRKVIVMRLTTCREYIKRAKILFYFEIPLLPEFVKKTRIVKCYLIKNSIIAIRHKT
jgi:hypothetical protein